MVSQSKRSSMKVTIEFLIASRYHKYRGFNIGTFTPVRFSVFKGGAKSMVVTISWSPQGGAYARALKSEKSLSPPIPVGGGPWIQMTGT